MRAKRAKIFATKGAITGWQIVVPHYRLASGGLSLGQSGLKQGARLGLADGVAERVGSGRAGASRAVLRMSARRGFVLCCARKRARSHSAVSRSGMQSLMSLTGNSGRVTQLSETAQVRETG